jgi:hypothetical protein
MGHTLMTRVHLFEFTDLPWYPHTFRRIQTDYLQYIGTRGAAHKHLTPLITKAMRHAGTSEIVDLCSGGGGLWRQLQEDFKQAKQQVRIRLTDKYPRPEIMEAWPEGERGGIEYFPLPVDAVKVPAELKGMRTLFEGFHHFKPPQAEAILRDAMDSRQAIGIFEITLQPPLGAFLLILAPITTLLSYLLLTPLIQPRSWWRFLWTYLLPLVPLATCWDGVVSMLRVYSEKELAGMTEEMGKGEYHWETGTVTTGTPFFRYLYLIGYPTGVERDLQPGLDPAPKLQYFKDLIQPSPLPKRDKGGYYCHLQGKVNHKFNQKIILILSN